ncbi:hypothetical protein JCM10049v2_000626 [Rhodotorula toruloides]
MEGLPMNTLTVTLSGLSTIGKTFLKHYVHRKKITKQTKARESLTYDEAFSVMKNFFENASMHTVEDVQRFGNNFVPAPFWVRVIRVVIPLSTRLEAGKVLIDTLGEDEIERVVGGREWWQRTTHKEGGVDGEWISMKRDWEGLEAESRARSKGKGKDKARSRRKKDDEAEEKTKQLKEDAKVENRRRRELGKARKAFPPSWTTASSSTAQSTTDLEKQAEDEAAARQRAADGSPSDSPKQPPSAPLDSEASSCHHEDDDYTAELDDMPVMLAIHGGGYFFGSINTHRYIYWRLARKTVHDCLAAYLYLIRPPPGAKHRPVDPSKITICGDSAGGGLAIALLCLLRDGGLPMPAGGILISPWCDLTHSFPSILQNTDTDIPPPFGFGIFKPSTLWPPPPAEFRKRADESTSLQGLKKAAHHLQHSGSRDSREPHTTTSEKQEKSERHGHRFPTLSTHHKAHELADAVERLPDNDPKRAEQHNGDASAATDETGASGQHKTEVSKVMKVEVDGKEVELVDQIQLYATNEQLVYPFVSPIWQPSLGGLPPLYVMAGDKEVLRDEIIYMAHRAAHPDRYPVREGILKQNPERVRKSKDYPPTKVHLQLYDEVCHDLPLFSFTTPAKYCFRAMASFAKWVTTPPDQQPSAVSPSGMTLPLERDPLHPDSAFLRPPDADGSSTLNGSAASIRTSRTDAGGSQSAPTTSAPSVSSVPLPGKKAKKRSAPPAVDLEKTIYSSTQPFNRPEYVDNMIRERISTTGVVRPMEPEEQMSMLKVDKEDVGLIKEAPVKRYLAGKAILERKFRRTYKSVQKERERHLKKSMREEAARITKRAKELAKQHSGQGSNSPSSRPNPDAVDPARPPRTDSPEPLDGHGESESAFAGLGGAWDLHGENPPPSSLAGRKDTLEARKLAKVLDEHYSRVSALHLWTGFQDVIGGAPRQESQDVNGDAPPISVQLGASSRPT